MNKHLICLGFAAIVALTGVVSAGDYSGGGNGTAEKPYRIATAEDMNAIGAHPNDWGSHFVMVNDINLAEYTGTEFNVIGHGWSDGFTGVFDGNGHTISNFTYTVTDAGYVGLFSCVDDVNAMIKDLTLVTPDVNAAGNSHHIGSLVGCLKSGTITGCSVKGGSVSGYDYTGGLMGYNYYGTISNCYATSSVEGREFTGGLVGNNSSTISNCYAAGSVTGDNGTGGLVGYNNGGMISNCDATGSITGYFVTGGLMGYTNGRTSNCYATGSVSGDLFTGGLVGRNSGTTSNCYATGSVTGVDYTGGLVGQAYQGTISNCFWDVNSSGLDISDGGEGKTTAEMQTMSTFTDAGWDFVGDDKPSDEWDMPEERGYPILWWQLEELPELPNFSGGTGIAENPYIIANANDLCNIGHNPRLMDKHFLLDNHIDMNGIEFYIIGDRYYPYTGKFDGNEHIITNLTVDVNNSGIDDNIGVFGYVDTGEVLNLGVEDISIILEDIDIGHGYCLGGVAGSNRGGSISNCYSTGSINHITYSGESHHYIGGVVGYNYNSTVLNCYSKVSVSSGVYSGENAYYLGGLAGYNNENSSIENCYSTGSVTGAPDCGLLADYLGGLVGSNSGTISSCHSTGSVNGDRLLGGLVGMNFGNIVDCYSTGSVSGGYEVGGLVGSNERGSIKNCYSTGLVNCGNESESIGGLAGRNAAHLSNCYSKGTVSVGDHCETIGGLVGSSLGDTISYCYSVSKVNKGIDSVNVGGFIGHDSNNHPSSFIADFWNSDINPGLPCIGNKVDPNVMAATISQMQTMTTFTDAGWDFVGETINGPNDIWDICEGTNYPKLVWQIPAADLLCPDGVNFIDFSFFAGHWLEETCAGSNDCEGSDLDQSGAVDINDLKILGDNWLEGL